MNLEKRRQWGSGLDQYWWKPWTSYGFMIELGKEEEKWIMLEMGIESTNWWGVKKKLLLLMKNKIMTYIKSNLSWYKIMNGS